MLYMPIHHGAQRRHDSANEFHVPFLYQKREQRKLRVVNYVNTERLFKIEKANTQEFKVRGHGPGTYSLTLDSMKVLASYVRQTPALRYNRESTTGGVDQYWGRKALNNFQISRLAEYVRENGVHTFEEGRFSAWLTTKSQRS